VKRASHAAQRFSRRESKQKNLGQKNKRCMGFIGLLITPACLPLLPFFPIFLSVSYG
jgi:O-antigen/teichoic acid export membrane protein